MVRGADAIGDTWVYLVIADEWGHAIQERLDPSLVAQGDEWRPTASRRGPVRPPRTAR